MVKTREDIKNEVIENIYRDSRVVDSDIRVDIADSKANLFGTAPNYIARQAAEHAALSVPGITSVNNQIIIRYKPETSIPHDRDIQTRVLDLLHWKPNIDPSGIKVRVNSGAVTLKGTVTSYWQKISIEEMVFEIRGVIKVVNELAVIPTRYFSDQTIAEDIIKSLEKNRNINIDLINIEVENGTVTLSGTVTSPGIYKEIERITSHTNGVKTVRNHIMISS